ncbi:MAG TPA: hypothetical protein VIJ82_21955 [Streptosporangiaceae bacterium]|jgi:hypothetical protein
MAIFIRPSRVIVEESGGGWLAAVVAVVGLAVVISAAAVVIADVLTAILITLAAAVAGSAGVLTIVLRRAGLSHPLPPGTGRAAAPVPAARSATAITGARLSIAPRPVIPGTVQAVTEENRPGR